MFKTLHKKFSILFIISFILGIILFCSIGATLAYFQVDNVVRGSYKFGKAGIEWQNGTTSVTSPTYTLTLSSPLKRGEEGVRIKDAEGSGEGDLKIHALDGTIDQYVRIKPKVTTSSDSGDGTDLTQYFTFTLVSSGSTYTLGTENFWKSGSDGWYYYTSNTKKLSASATVSVLNTIALNDNFPSEYLGQELKIEIQAQSIQTENGAVASAWGENAATILGITAS